MVLLNQSDEMQYRTRSIINLSLQQDDNKEYYSTGNSKFILSMGSTIESNNFKITGNYSAVISSNFTITKSSKNSRVLVIDTPGYCALEELFSTLVDGIPGNLSYIDGCSNSNLIHPPRNGDPCVNYLYIPPNTNQTFHTHPSIRAGIILGGEGKCDLPDTEIPLTCGTSFALDRHEVHRFRTGNSPLWLFVFHPDSESGPVDEANPMKTRTYIK